MIFLVQMRLTKTPSALEIRSKFIHDRVESSFSSTVGICICPVGLFATGHTQETTILAFVMTSQRRHGDSARARIIGPKGFVMKMRISIYS
jgi:hypothetical protein